MTSRKFTSRRHSQRAFSLVEIMVGMTIGLLGMIIIMQMSSLFEARKRTTSGGDDAQNGGAIALFTLQNPVSQAGYGISNSNLIGKSLTTPFITINPLQPLTVNPAQLTGIQTANTDSFLIIYGNNNDTTEGALIKNPIASTIYTVDGGISCGASVVAPCPLATGGGGKSFAIGDWVIPSQNTVTTTLNLFQVSAPIPTPNSTVPLIGSPPALTTNPVNPPLLFNLGSAPTIRAYAVIGGSLKSCDYFAQNCATNINAWTTIAENIMTMRLQCVSTSALRIALVTRSIQIDTGIVTLATPVWILIALQRH